MNIQMGTGKTGYAEELRQHDRQKNRTARTVLPGQDWPDRAAKIGLLGQDSQGITERIGQAEQDRLGQRWTVRTEQAEQRCQDRTGRTGLPTHDC